MCVPNKMVQMATYNYNKILCLIGWPIDINEYKQMLKKLTFISQFEIIVNLP
jgi:hypothetical protein